jgi:DnaJ-class molecular chaperone
MEQKDYYQILGVEQNAAPEQIKDAYRKMAFEYHPDRNAGNPESADTMKRVNEAYAVLSNPEKRRDYDAMRQQFGSSAHHRFRQAYTEQDIFKGSDIFHVFEEMTRAFGLRDPDEIFKEFYGKGYKNFEFKQPGFYAKGSVFFGGFGKSGRQPQQIPGLGNLGRLSRYVFKKLTGADIQTDGADITEVIRLTPRQAVDGGPYAYHYRKKDRKLVVQIPKGIRQGQRIRLEGQGEEGKSGGKPGDLYLKVEIKKPLLEKIKDLTGGLLK